MDRASLEAFLRDMQLTHRPAAGSREFVLDCPFCGKAAHLYINAETTQYECKVCGARGNLVTLRQHLGDMTGNGNGAHAVRKVPKRPDNDLGLRALSNHAALPPAARAYLEARGLGPAIDMFKLGYRRDANGQEWITIPYWRDGKVTQVRRRAMAGTPRDTQGAKYEGDPGVPVELYNVDALDGQHALLVEGELKAALISLHIPELAVVGLPGTTFKPEWDKHFEGVERIYLCLDPGEPNDKALDNIVSILGGQRVFVVNCPDKPDDYMRAHGVDAFRNCLADARPVDQPAAVREGNVFRFPFRKHALDVEVSRPKDFDGESIKAWLSIRSATHGRLYNAPANLTGVRAIPDLVKRLNTRLRINWDGILDHVFQTVVDAVLQVGEMQLVHPRLRERPMLMERFLGAGELTEVWAPPESCKGYFLLFVMQALEHGIPLPHNLQIVRKVRGVYLDWEANEDIFAHRLYLVQRGLGIEPHPVPYRKMRRPMHEEMDAVRRDLDHYRAEMLIADSYIMGAGASPEGGDASARFWGPLSALTPAVTPIGVNHVSRASLAMTGQRYAYGGIGGDAIIRSGWEMRRSDDHEGNEAIFALYHRKANERGHQKPMGFRLVFESDRVLLSAADIETQEDLVQPLSATDRILAFLKQQGDKAETTDVAQGTGLPVKICANKLGLLYRRKKIVRFGDPAPGRSVQWGIASDREEP